MKRSLSVLCALTALLFLAACRPTPTPHPPTATPVPPAATPLPATVAPDEPAAGETPFAPTGDLLTVLGGLGQFAVLGQAIEDADLTEKLQSDGPYTFFAPTDAAFDAVQADLLADPDLLFDILLYHVAEQRLTAQEAASQGTATSLFGDKLTFSTGDTLMVDGVPVLQADIMADNGIIHIVETVLMPPTLGDE